MRILFFNVKSMTPRGVDLIVKWHANAEEAQREHSLMRFLPALYIAVPTNLMLAMDQDQDDAPQVIILGPS